MAAAQEDSLLGPITGAADRSESTTILVAKARVPVSKGWTIMRPVSAAAYNIFCKELL
jgi:hypothetical protein